MKTKSCLVVVLVFLCLSVATMATEMEEATALAVVTESDVSAEPVALASTSEDCGAGTVSERFAPPRVELAFTGMCGTCSHRLCQGRAEGSWCGIGKWCLSQLPSVCSGTLDWNCQCAGDVY